jgi:hypothetical protein
MIRERCSCGAKFETNEVEAVKLWREWRHVHQCSEAPDPVEANTSAETRIETSLGFAPNWHPGREDPALEE